MKSIVILTLVTLASSGPFNPDLDSHWERFKETYNKNYRPREEEARRLIWEQHVAAIVRHNLDADLGLHTYRKGINEYSDMSGHEFVKTMNGYLQSNRTRKLGSVFIASSNIVLPDTIDWRKEGLVTPVKNQKLCGSCWAFSTTGSLEGQHKKKTGRLVSLSEQNLVDCSLKEGNEGCLGGLVDLALQYVIKNNGIDTEQSYPYIAEVAYRCWYEKKFRGATSTGYVDIPSQDEAALQKAIATVGPISVIIDASQNSFQLYKSGVYDEPECDPTFQNHAVLAVGYGTENGKDYWLVKNSWGTSWGEEGYIKMLRNKKNQCGVATLASYPLM